ncbi:MAG: BMP family ABC transporter substrate-binding protein [Chloroflexi bacterium]|nr:BMP family ABC transporter substrate-binding protein [Chloroflexota bacterium]
MQFRILGSLSVVGNGSVAALGPPKQRALLAILLTRIGEVVPVERLIELLWGAAAPRTADHSIQIYVSDLRRAFEPLGGSDRLVTRQPGYALEVDPDSVDAWRFERLVKEGTRLLEGGDQDAGRSTIREALGLWSGPPLSDFPYEEFAQPVVRRLTEERLTAVEAYAAASLEAGRITEALDLLTAAVQDDPLRERARELLMLALYRSGRHADALRSFHALRTQLTDEFGVDPSPSIRALYDRILAHDPSLAKGSLSAPNVRVTLAGEGAGVGGDRLGVERGFDRAVSDFSLVSRKENVFELAYRDWSLIVRGLSEQAPALIVSLSFHKIDAIAHEHPGTHYLVLDYVGSEPNVSYTHFRDCEASFLAGAAAAHMSQTGIVGFIGGWDAIPIWGFLAGYQAGVRATNASVRMIMAYAGEWPTPQGFVDLDRNEELARQMFADGADVILAASGPAGMGVVSAAAALSGSMGRHLWAIGVDTDWYEDLSHNLGIISPGAWRSHVLTSVRKRFDLAVYEALQTVASGDRLPPVKAYDLRSGFVGISYEGGFLDDIRPLIEDQRRRIVSGQLRVPCLPSDHVEVARAHLEQTGVTLDDWLDQGCPPWRISIGAVVEQAR